MTAHSHEGINSKPTIFSDQPVATAIAVGIASLVPHFFLPVDLSVVFAALLISLIAGSYFGFAVVNGDTRQQMIEFNVAGMFVLAALLGVAFWPGIVALAYFAHAGWDFALHNRNRLSLVQIPQWYVPWCVIIDIIVGAGLLVFWWSKGVI